MSQQDVSKPGRRVFTGERMHRLRASHSYGFVLGLIIATFLFTAAAPDTDWAHSTIVLLMSATLAVALWTSGLGATTRLPAVVLALLGLTGSILQLLSADSNVYAGLGLFTVLLAASTCTVIAVGVFDQREVNQQSVVGVVCIYVLVGLLYTFLYGAIAEAGSAAFFAQGIDGDPKLHLYFSYVTLGTLGYGDYTAASDLGRTLSITEALFGQLYLVTVIAVVVSKLGHRKAPKIDE